MVSSRTAADASWTHPTTPLLITGRPRALVVAWEASGYVCSERLQPFLPELVPLLEQHQDLSVDDATPGLPLFRSPTPA
jgi:hypothetical protein